MQLACQVTILVLLTLKFLAKVHASYNGVTYKPTGAGGVLVLVFLLAITLSLFYGAGALSEVIKLLQSL